jgi:hypothetical protein
MISGAAGAMTVVMGDLTSDRGPLRSFTRPERIEQLLMCVLLIGGLEVLLAPLLCAFVKVSEGAWRCVWLAGGQARWVDGGKKQEREDGRKEGRKD